MAAEKVSPTVAKGGAIVSAVVRRGTVVWGGGPRKRHEAIHSGPGQEVRLPAETVAKLRRAGVLHDPQTPEIPVGLGPNFNLEDGVQVAPAAPVALADPAAAAEAEA